MERESLSLTASITSLVVVTGCPFMLTITSWSLNPELGGEKKKEHETQEFYLSQLELNVYLYGTTILLVVNIPTWKPEIASILSNMRTVLICYEIILKATILFTFIKLIFYHNQSCIRGLLLP